MDAAARVEEHLHPNGVGVVIEVEHRRMAPRGERATGAEAVPSAAGGRLRSEGRSRHEFWPLAHGGSA